MFRAVNWGIFFPLSLSIGALLALSLIVFLLGQALSGRLVVMGGCHNCLGSGSDVILQRREFIHPTIQLFHSYWWVQRQGLEKRGGRPKAPSEIL